MAGVAGVIYLGTRQSIEEEAANFFPLPRRERLQAPARVARDLYGKLRTHGLPPSDARDTAVHAMLEFEGEQIALLREGHAPDAVAAYLYNLLIVDGTIEGEKREALRTIHAQKYHEGPGRARTRKGRTRRTIAA